MKPLASIPTLDQIAADPASACDVPPDAARALLSGCIVALAALNARLLAGPAAGSDAAPEADRRLSVEEAAAKLAMSRHYLYRNADKLPFTVRIGRSIGFSEAGIAKFLRQRAGR